ncbi:methionyl-tRNA ligase [Natrinema pallidum DSM 3751]|uniref:Methionyl-tRNA synthetase n=1 Tax=Natrinema pallidum DSM 3751 TaxID=1227495 RepID=L9YGM4_9EURY|nr:methionyl-tRNA ligase [Natrinema pallidum DSM 3751]
MWANDYLNEGFHPDLIRYYLITTGGFQQDVDFSWEKFQERVNGELVGTVGNFAYRSLLFAARNYNGTPDATTSKEVAERIREAVTEFKDAINDYSIKQAGDAAVALAAFGNEYIQRNEPWHLTDDEPQRAKQVIYDCVQIVKAVAVLATPILPGKTQRLWDQLGEDSKVHEVNLNAALESPPRNFNEPEELFEKIEDEHIDDLNERLRDRIEAATETEDESMSDDLEALANERISFDDFQELDIRVGRIESAEGIEGADDLARLEVDIGFETRQVVAGIKQLHDLDELPGEKCVLLTNMEKAELFGVESNGMILAAGEEADLLTTHGDADVGEKIR